MKKFAVVVLALIVAVSGAAIADDNQARARAVHASPDAPPVDIKVNDEVAIEDLEFNETSDYVPVDANVYNFKIVPTGAMVPVVLDADLSLFFNTDYTIVAVGLLAELGDTTDTAFGAVVLEDDNSEVPAGMSRVRLLHASPGAPEVDVRIDNGPYLFQDVEFKEVGDYVMVPAGTVDILVEAGGLTVPFFGVTFEQKTTYTVFATGLVGGDPAFGLLPSADSGQGANQGGGDDDENDDDEYDDDNDDRRQRFLRWWKSR